ncbi:MAG: NAD(P)H-hydrate dehydratase [Thermodesulfobacteriota bacterium]|nr:NAD(P)H-hydrate dehydratase [Thermodesulfobacteriota bacterium]
MYLVTAGEIQQMDRQTIESFGIPGRVLMENAGRGATRVIFDQFDDIVHKTVGVLAGRGNNGGDGFVIARYLAQKGSDVTVYLLAQKTRVQGDAAANLKLLAPLNVPVIEIPDEQAFLAHKTGMRHQKIWVDALLGTGLKSDVTGYFKQIIEFINTLGKPVFSVDIPSGLNSDTGQVCGTCIRAQATATFAFAKLGHILLPGAEFTGYLEIIDIGIPDLIAKNIRPKQHLLTLETIRNALKPRAPDYHKGTAGHALVISGSVGKTGAAAMTAMSAMRAGAGLVTLALPQSLNPVLETQVVEAMTCPLPHTQNGRIGESSFNTIMDLLSGKKCLAIGPGLGDAAETKKLVHRIIQESPVTMVIDADGLNHIAGSTEILKKTTAPVILTPHPGEMARLIDSTADLVQKDRITCARRFAEKYNAHVVLKGAKTIIAHPEGHVFINPTGNPGMASGGMGDVLTGIITGLVAQGYSAESATHTGVYLHGAAADTLAEKVGPFGYLATEVMNAIPGQIKLIV